MLLGFSHSPSPCSISGTFPFGQRVSNDFIKKTRLLRRRMIPPPLPPPPAPSLPSLNSTGEKERQLADGKGGGGGLWCGGGAKSHDGEKA
jgi:hypothetical protein